MRHDLFIIGPREIAIPPQLPPPPIAIIVVEKQSPENVEFGRMLDKMMLDSARCVGIPRTFWNALNGGGL